MGLLPWSFGFLLIFSLLLWTQLKTMTEATILHTISLRSTEAEGDKLCAEIEDLGPPSTGQGSSNKQHRASHPRDNRGQRTSRLHLNGFFQGNNQYKDSQKTVFFRLVQVLYGNQPIFHEGDNSAAVEALFEKVCKKAEELPQKISLLTVEDLGIINLRDNPLIPNHAQKAFYHMLLGGKGELVRNKKCTLEGLQYYISLRPNYRGEGKIASVYLAPKKLLLALFGEENVVAEILSFRKEIWKRLREKDADKNSLEAELRQKFERSLLSGIDINAIDFQISTTKPHDKPRNPFKRH